MSDLCWLSDEQMATLTPVFPKLHGKPRVDAARRIERPLCRKLAEQGLTLLLAAFQKVDQHKSTQPDRYVLLCV